MSNMNELKRFENDLKTNEELGKKLDEAIKRIVSENKAQSDGEIMAAAAKELGYDVSVTMLEQAKAEAEQLDLAEMEHVSGGAEWCMRDYECLYAYINGFEDKSGHDIWCVSYWHCYTVYMHTEGGTKMEACWSNYKCNWINE